jgi:opacity protein-like surface antigen
MRRFTILAPLGLALMAAASPALPAERGFYVSADAGVSQGEGEFTGGSAVNFVRTIRDDDSKSLRVRAGYQFARFIAVEVGYVDLGDFAFDIGPSSCPPAIPTNCDFTTHVSANGPFANAVFILPVGEKFRFKVRVGWYALQFETRESGPNASANPNRGKDSEGGAHVGVGAALRATDKLEIELEYSRFAGPDFAQMGAPGPAHFEVGKISTVTLGVAYRF